MQIDFYILGENSHRDINQMVCQLCEKAIAQHMNVFIYTQSIEQAHQLDELLWTFKPDNFLTHKNELSEIETDSTFTYPIIISSDVKNATKSQHYQFLINLSNESPDLLANFKRIAEMVGKAPDDKEIARNRYRFYRDKGYTLNKYDL
ncbi:MAG: DNA polymerase III subunit chi [gamma proteobacterium symbiont of Bathyaustriella thionipta]|nr:DNA polymerase III subunit chi [gamma proteobacterium symbiont of Bathyaustriella thionipta]MCU7949684.1 DNA polymerase III subunit chi [gamma proteobacterium symbiont of Bathyaustriella thionipta]MCU7952052.1 DNA polymerase III subunit chi [gamma proteobacterium symbiont of Bathyaustriella thionipta]MCU7956282.1 DNA polymerase III subunit chi [gamma proteobacterium symbiont of Bathyaustriella thionipta]MCU7968624.1 DNA polymerase III subunit chi [gamma proteobacterium symbiont of Bathyaustr